MRGDKPMQENADNLLLRVIHHLEMTYSGIALNRPLEDIAGEFLELMRLSPDTPAVMRHRNHWDQREIAMITYGDSVQCESERPLATLQAFPGRTTAGDREQRAHPALLIPGARTTASRCSTTRQSTRRWVTGAISVTCHRRTTT